MSPAEFSLAVEVQLGQKLQTKSQVLISPLLGNWSRSRIEHFPHSEKPVSQALSDPSEDNLRLPVIHYFSGPCSSRLSRLVPYAPIHRHNSARTKFSPRLAPDVSSGIV